MFFKSLTGISRLQWLRFSFLFFLIAGSLFLAWTVGSSLSMWISKSESVDIVSEEESGLGEFFDEYMRFEGSIYDYISDEISRLSYENKKLSSIEEGARGQSDLEDSVLGDLFYNGDKFDLDAGQMEKVGNSALQKIEDFVDEKKALLTPALNQRVNKLKLSVSMRILSDRKMSEEIIEELNNDVEKIGILNTYATFFAKVDREKVKKFLLRQKKWTDKIDPNYSSNLDVLLFNADPVGQAFPNHFGKILGTRGQSLNLKEFSGKYLLVDFWASWCAPCLEEMPYIKEMYNVFYPNHFDIIAVSLDSDRKSFDQTIDRYKLRWNQYFDGEAFSGDLVKKYGVTSLPTKFLIDPDGKVVLANVSAEKMLGWLREELTHTIGEEFRERQTRTAPVIQKKPQLN